MIKINNMSPIVYKEICKYLADNHFPVGDNYIVDSLEKRLNYIMSFYPNITQQDENLLRMLLGDDGYSCVTTGIPGWHRHKIEEDGSVRFYFQKCSNDRKFVLFRR